MKFTFGIDSSSNSSKFKIVWYLKFVFYLRCDFKINIIKFDVF